jgi:hypothetical protein
MTDLARPPGSLLVLARRTVSTPNSDLGCQFCRGSRLDGGPGARPQNSGRLASSMHSS